jgi:hypothetical protein
MAGEAADNGRRLSLIALDLANQSDPAEMATRVAGLAAKLIACTAADIVHPAGAGAIRVAASSDSVLSLSSAKLWQRWPHPPAAAVPNARNLSHPDPAGYREQLRTDCGIANELLLELRVGFTDHGYLRFLFRDENRLPPADIELITAYCIHAALALDRAALRVQADTLRDALISNRQIGTAIGILMTRRGIEYEPAFALLKTRSQRANRKLHRVAADVVRTGKLPAEIDRRTSASVDRQTGRQWFSVG